MLVTIKSRTSSNSGQIRTVTLELCALEGRLYFQETYYGLSPQDLLANLDQILYAASVGWGKGCFLGFGADSIKTVVAMETESPY